MWRHDRQYPHDLRRAVIGVRAAVGRAVVVLTRLHRRPRPPATSRRFAPSSAHRRRPAGPPVASRGLRVPRRRTSRHRRATASGCPPTRVRRRRPARSSVTLQHLAGRIPMTLNQAKAPCTVQSFAVPGAAGLLRQHAVPPAHRGRLAEGVAVRRPDRHGTGGPGYTIPDENPTGLTPAPGGRRARDSIRRGRSRWPTPAKPHSGGSQFFLVYADSELPPTYAVFGTVSGGRPDHVGQDRGGRHARRRTASTDGRPACRSPSRRDGTAVTCWAARAAQHVRSGSRRLGRRRRRLRRCARP